MVDKVETITYSINDNGVVTTTEYMLAKYVPDVRQIDSNYTYITLLDRNYSGLLIRVRNSDNARDIDFKAVTIQNRATIDEENKKFFMKGSFLTDKLVFKDVRVGAEFNKKLMDFSLDVYLAKKVTDIVRYKFDKKMRGSSGGLSERYRLPERYNLNNYR